MSLASSLVEQSIGPTGTKPRRLTAPRVAMYVFLVLSALFFLMPLYVMIVTSLKDMSEIRQGHIFALPAAVTFKPWIKAWFSACFGLTCTGVSTGFLNSIKITLPAVACSVALGAVNGYALSFWRFPGANLIFAILMAGAFIPLQVFIYPIVRIIYTSWR